LVFIPVTLLGNDPDPIVHWYFTSSPVAEHVNLAVCVRSTLYDDGCVINVGGVTIIKTKLYSSHNLLKIYQY